MPNLVGKRGKTGDVDHEGHEKHEELLYYLTVCGTAMAQHLVGKTDANTCWGDSCTVAPR